MGSTGPAIWYTRRVANYEVLWLKGTDQVSQAAGVAARALRDNPSTVAVSSDRLVRLEMMHSTFTAMLSGARVAGVRRGKSILGVAGAVPPGECIDAMLPPEVRTLDVPAPEATDADRFLYLGSILAANDLLESHWHVGPVGVEPGFQGMGMGRAAMELLCGEFDEHGRLAWLETDKPENVRFYSGLGFEVVDEIQLLSARNWFMRREAR
jgi:ribosomal protein S18 acetylase RimI-like enzyme